MKNEDKIVELLSELLLRQDKSETVLNKLVENFDKMGTVINEMGTAINEMGTVLNEMGTVLIKMSDSQERLIAVQERQEKILIKILEVLADDVPKFDELIEMEQLEGGKKVVLRKSR
ncbi:MAG: hypothetical protein WD431_11535 [Cyclobacteriaceae bacterium]